MYAFSVMQINSENMLWNLNILSLTPKSKQKANSSFVVVNICADMRSSSSHQNKKIRNTTIKGFCNAYT